MFAFSLADKTYTALSTHKFLRENGKCEEYASDLRAVHLRNISWSPYCQTASMTEGGTDVISYLNKLQQNLLECDLRLQNIEKKWDPLRGNLLQSNQHLPLSEKFPQQYSEQKKSVGNMGDNNFLSNDLEPIKPSLTQDCSMLEDETSYSNKQTPSNSYAEGSSDPTVKDSVSFDTSLQNSKGSVGGNHSFNMYGTKTQGILKTASATECTSKFKPLPLQTDYTGLTNPYEQSMKRVTFANDTMIINYFNNASDTLENDVKLFGGTVAEALEEENEQETQELESNEKIEEYYRISPCEGPTAEDELTDISLLNVRLRPHYYLSRKNVLKLMTSNSFDADVNAETEEDKLLSAEVSTSENSRQNTDEEYHQYNAEGANDDSDDNWSEGSVVIHEEVLDYQSELCEAIKYYDDHNFEEESLHCDPNEVSDLLISSSGNRHLQFLKDEASLISQRLQEIYDQLQVIKTHLVSEVNSRSTKSEQSEEVEHRSIPRNKHEVREPVQTPCSSSCGTELKESEPPVTTKKICFHSLTYLLLVICLTIVLLEGLILLTVPVIPIAVQPLRKESIF